MMYPVRIDDGRDDKVPDRDQIESQQPIAERLRPARVPEIELTQKRSNFRIVSIHISCPDVTAPLQKRSRSFTGSFVAAA